MMVGFLMDSDVCCDKKVQSPVNAEMDIQLEANSHKSEFSANSKHKCFDGKRYFSVYLLHVAKQLRVQQNFLIGKQF